MDIKELTEKQKEEIYNERRKFHLKADVVTFAKYDYGELSEADLDIIASRWVDDGEYDCNLSYWDNIENLVRDVIKY